MQQLEDAGAEVVPRPGAMAYQPSSVAGEPGRFILDPEASYGALQHEMSHFLDDEAAGYPGLRYWLEDPAIQAGGEARAYGVEIDNANSIGAGDIADQLANLRDQAIGDILGSLG
jgi:hypothetical protein